MRTLTIEEPRPLLPGDGWQLTTQDGEWGWYTSPVLAFEYDDYGGGPLVVMPDGVVMLNPATYSQVWHPREIILGEPLTHERVVVEIVDGDLLPHAEAAARIAERPSDYYGPTARSARAELLRADLDRTSAALSRALDEGRRPV